MERFRHATEQDIDAIMDMMRRYYREDGYAFAEAEAKQAVRDLIHDEHLGHLWVAEEQGCVVGYLAVTLGFSLEYRGRDAFIDELFISESARRHGLGREAIETAQAYCRQRGVQAIHLEVERHRETAGQLYRWAGFQNHDRYLMTKRINDPGP